MQNIFTGTDRPRFRTEANLLIYRHRPCNDYHIQHGQKEFTKSNDSTYTTSAPQAHCQFRERRGEQNHRRISEKIQNHEQEQLDSRNVACFHIQKHRRGLSHSVQRTRYASIKTHRNERRILHEARACRSAKSI